MTPNARDLATFWSYALAWRFTHPAAVIAWADRIVALQDEPPAWAIELCMAAPDDVDEHLRHVPGKLTGSARFTFSSPWCGVNGKRDDCL